MGETKIGLVLEGGGMRGVYTAGVLDAFLDAGLEFDGTLGVSAGSCHAASFLSKQRGRAYRVNVSYLNDWRYCSARSWLTTGDFFGAKMLYDTIPNQLDLYDHTAFEQRRGWFRAVVTNLASGEAEYPVIEDLHRDIIWLQASSSLPLLSRTVEIEGQEYLDGGISDSIPVKEAMRLGCEKNVIVLTQCAQYRKKPNELMPLIRAKYRRYPKLIELMATRHLRYNETLEEIEALKQQGKVFVIQPQKPVTIGRLEKNRSELHALYRVGVEDGAAQAEALREFMGR